MEERFNNKNYNAQSFKEQERALERKEDELKDQLKEAIAAQLGQSIDAVVWLLV